MTPTLTRLLEAIENAQKDSVTWGDDGPSCAQWEKILELAAKVREEMRAQYPTTKGSQ